MFLISFCAMFIDGKGCSKMGFLDAQGVVRYIYGRSES
jgi:hypothetical protein